MKKVAADRNGRRRTLSRASERRRRSRGLKGCQDNYANRSESRVKRRRRRFCSYKQRRGNFASPRNSNLRKPVITHSSRPPPSLIHVQSSSSLSAYIHKVALRAAHVRTRTRRVLCRYIYTRRVFRAWRVNGKRFNYTEKEKESPYTPIV